MIKFADTLRESMRCMTVLGRIFFSALFWATCLLLTSLWSRKTAGYERTVLHRWVNRLFAITAISIDLRVEEALSPASGPFIFMANHRSFMDIPILAAVLRPFSPSWVALSCLVHVPFFGWAFRRFDPILVRPGDKTRNRVAMEAARKTLSKGNSLLVFPEGGLSRNARLLPLKAGFFKLALETGIPIVPVTIIGTDHLLPPGSYKIKSGTVRVFIGSRLPTSSSVDNLRDAVRTKMESYLKNAEKIWDSFSCEVNLKELKSAQGIYPL